MGVTHLLAGVLLLAAPPTPDARPAVAIANFRTAADINPDMARVLEDRVAESLRRAQVFSRIIGTRDVEAVLGLEQARQLVACTQDSCLVELAGALGVDLLLTGQLTRVGASLSLSLKLINTRNANLAGAASAVFKNGEAQALDGTEALTRRLVDDAALRKPAAETQAPAGGGGGGVMPKVVLGVGGVAAVAGAVVVLAGLVGAAVGVTAFLVQRFYYLPSFGLSGEQRVLLFPFTGMAVAGLGGVGLLLGGLLVAAGVASGVAGWTLL